MLNVRPEGRDRRLVGALLVLGVTALFFVVVEQLASLFFYFGDILLTFFLAWLIAFIISPVVTRIVDAVPRLPRAVAAIIVYALVVIVMVLTVVVAAGALATSIAQFVASIPDIRANLPTIVAPWQQWLTSIGLGQIDLVAQATAALSNLDQIAGALVEPLQQIAVASLGRGRDDADRLLPVDLHGRRPRPDRGLPVPPRPAGLRRGGAPAADVRVALVRRLPARPGADGDRLLPDRAGHEPAARACRWRRSSSVSAGILQAIPFFGPFVSWAPPVIVALVLQPDATVPAILLMGIGWVVVMNVLQPRIMQDAVGIHPIVVLGSVLIGSRIAGIPGAIFGIPIAAVVSAFFFQFLHRTSGDRTVAGRAARRLADREGRQVHVPREPAPGSAADIDDPHPAGHPT